MTSASRSQRRSVYFSARSASFGRRSVIFNTKSAACCVSRASMGLAANSTLNGMYFAQIHYAFSNQNFRRPATGPLADGPPMPSAPGEENPVPDDRPMTAPPAWRTIHTKRKPAKKREAQPAPPPPPPPMPSAPTPAPPMPVYHHQVPTAPPASAMMPPPSVMDQSRQQSWYAWQRE